MIKLNFINEPSLNQSFECYDHTGYHTFKIEDKWIILKINKYWDVIITQMFITKSLTTIKRSKFIDQWISERGSPCIVKFRLDRFTHEIHITFN